MSAVIVGGGRVGLALAAMAPSVVIGRGQRIPDREGPIYVCTRNDDLDAVLAQTPWGRREDLVFVQNGMLQDWLAEHGLQDNTQALLYFAVSRRGEAPVDGGGTVVSGRWSKALCAHLEAGGIRCEAVSHSAMLLVMAEKLLWNCVFGLLCEARGVSVGALVKEHHSEVAALTLELGAVAESTLGARLPADIVKRLCDYSEQIPDYVGAVKEFRWRNGWFLGQQRTPLHVALLERTGHLGT